MPSVRRPAAIWAWRSASVTQRRPWMPSLFRGGTAAWSTRARKTWTRPELRPVSGCTSPRYSRSSGSTRAPSSSSSSRAAVSAGECPSEKPRGNSPPLSERVGWRKMDSRPKRSPPAGDDHRAAAVVGVDHPGIGVGSPCVQAQVGQDQIVGGVVVDHPHRTAGGGGVAPQGDLVQKEGEVLRGDKELGPAAGKLQILGDGVHGDGSFPVMVPPGRREGRPGGVGQMRPEKRVVGSTRLPLR